MRRAKQIGLVETPDRQQDASGTASTIFLSQPAANNNDTRTIKAILDDLVELQKYRKFSIKGQQMCDRRTEALIASSLGYDLQQKDQDQKARKAIFLRAAEIRESIEGADRAVIKANDKWRKLVLKIKEITEIKHHKALLKWDAAMEKRRPGDNKPTPPEPVLAYPDPPVREVVAPPTLPDDVVTSRPEKMIRSILASATARSVYDNDRSDTETAMIKLAGSLPIYPWASEISGLGELGLSILVAEAAGFDLDEEGVPHRRAISDYRTVSGLWKRMCVAVMPDGTRQRKSRNAADALEQKYKPARRSEGWVVTESLLKKQVCGEARACREALLADPKASTALAKRGIDVAEIKTAKALHDLTAEFGIEARSYALGHYGDVYLRRKAHTAIRVELTREFPDVVNGHFNPEKWTPSRCDRDAKRVMFKDLLKDMWVEWRRVDREATTTPLQDAAD
jgi:hypothetical protein